MRIAIDFAMLSRPYMMSRCSYQLMHFAIIADRLGHEVHCITSPWHLKKHKFMKKVKRLWHLDRNRLAKEIGWDLYIAKSDAYYRDENWEVVEKLPGFKVCLCNSDRTFRETNVPFRKHRGNPVQERCDLYMPCNHTASLIKKWGDKVVPASHPVDPRMFKAIKRKRLYYAYLMDDLDKMRNAFKTEEIAKAGFMGNKIPSNRQTAAASSPSWCDFHWARSERPEQFIKWMCQRRGCIDIRGFGDKSLRFSEAAMFGRTLICEKLPSLYSPELVDGHNCILLDNWAGIANLEYDEKNWLELAEQSTADYLSGWSLQAQLRTMIDRSGG